MRIMCVQGSMARPAHTAGLLATVTGLLERRGAETDVVDLRDTPLPYPDPEYHHNPEDHPDPVVADIVERAEAAEGFVLASPVYHNSYSGVLKLFLDHLAIKHFDGKAVALCGNGGRRGSVQPCDHLRIVVRGLHGVAIPYNIVSTNDEFVEADDGLRVQSESLVKRLDLMTEQLVAFTQALGKTGARA